MSSESLGATFLIGRLQSAVDRVLNLLWKDLGEEE
jgi:hypothetical protein